MVLEVLKSVLVMLNTIKTAINIYYMYDTITDTNGYHLSNSIELLGP